MATPPTSPPTTTVSSPSPTSLASTAANVSSSMFSSVTVQNIGSMVPIKLKRDNYLLWKSLFAPIFRRYRLSGIVDGTEPCPSVSIPDSTGSSTIPNPAFDTWYEKDQNIIIWINSTLSEDLIPFTVGIQSARDLWLNLEKRFAGVSRSHVHHLRSRLQSMQKGTSSVSEYLQQIKQLSDALAAAGAPIDDSDIIAIILNGLPSEFESFIDSIELRLTSTSVDDLHGLLLSKELSLARKKLQSSSSHSEPFKAFASTQGASAPLLSTPPSFQAPHTYSGSGPHQAFAATHFRSRGRGSRHFGSSKSSSQFQAPPRNSSSTYGQGRAQYLPSPHYSSGGKTVCQICNSSGHAAIDCYNRMNHAFHGRIPPAKLSAMCANATSAPSSSTWLVDSGASSHMTPHYNNLQTPSAYNGQEQVFIGDGQGPRIGEDAFSGPC
ncbi:uncharacterized protein LOC110746720 isoform X2 [Prunus avium]|uniref:Uncharacterized protein LOC110746720 isoform X2 n=1 Tax=Prunus avium TaxID=42229 RepID=A0A6P5RI53_PRUAV|nr:uncharacterized protein LOC110746720 isoform X2 [Prunus avium]